MLNIIIVSDDIDEAIGANCVLSCQHLNDAVDLSSQNVKLLNGHLCGPTDIENAIISFNQERFILVAYSHGSEDTLFSTVASGGYVSSTNAYQFATSLVYTNSCWSGVKLKDELIKEGCHGFVGYTDSVRLPYNEEDDLLFIECENKGLVHLLTTDASLTESVEEMKKQYREQYDKFVDQQMNVSAALLLHNLGGLTFYDYQGLTRSELEGSR